MSSADYKAGISTEGTLAVAHTVPLVEIIDLLLPIRIFDDLDHDELTTVARLMRCIEVQPKEVVFREGQMGDVVCFVAEGELDVVKTSMTGESVLLTTLQRGSSIGEMGLIDEQPRSATVRAKTRSILVTLSGKAFNKILDEHPRVGLRILTGIAKLLSGNLRYTSACLADHMLPVS